MTDQPHRDAAQRRHVLDDGRNVRWLLRALFAACLLALAAELVVDRYVNHPWEALAGFYAVVAFAACIVLTIVGRALRKALWRRDDYYE